MKYQSGDEVWIKALELKATILCPLDPGEDEVHIGDKWLVRTEEHRKCQVFSCEITPFENGANPVD